MSIPMSRQGFVFGALDTEKGPRALGEDAVTLANNVRMVREDRYEKAPGTTRLTPSLLSSSLGAGSWSGATEYLTGLDDGLFAREVTDGEEWVYNATANRWISRGIQVRPFPNDDVVIPQASLARPRMQRGTLYEWHFAVGLSLGSAGYWFSVLDINTREVVVQPTFVASASILNLAPIQTSDGNIVVYVVDGSEIISQHTHTEASPTTVPAKTTYYTSTLGATYSLKEVDTWLLTSPGSRFLAAWGCQNASNNVGLHHSILSADGASASSFADNAGSAPGSATAGANAESVHGSILNSDGANGKAYYAIWQPNGSSAQMVLVLHTITLSSLADSQQILDAITYNDTTTSPLFAAAGYLAGNGDRIVFGTFLPTAGSGTTLPATAGLAVRRAFTFRYVLGSGLTEEPLMYEHWVAGRPVQVGSDWYVLMQYDDGEGFRNQRTYFLVKDQAANGGRVVSQALRGLAPAAGNNISLGNSGEAANTAIPTMFVVGGDIIVPALKAGASGVSAFSATRLRFGFAEDYGPPAAHEHVAICPGPIPYAVGPRDARREVSPLSSPSFIAHSLTLGAGFILQAYYQFTDSNGDVYQSRPTPEIAVTALGTVQVPTLKHVLNPSVKAQIVMCVSLSGAATPQIRQILENDPVSETRSFVLATPTTEDVAIYTAGGALGNDPWPPTRCISQHRQRFILGGLDEAEFIQPTREFEPGRGPAINVASRAPWRKGTGNVKAMGRVDGQTTAILKGDAVGVIEGNGPNGRAFGNFVVKTISEEDGIARARSFCNGPAGLYYQDRAGMIAIITPSQTIREASTGIDDLTRSGYIMQAGIHHKEANLVVLSMTASDGSTDPLWAFLDYRHPTQRHPAGRWSLRRSDRFLTMYGAANLSGDVYWVEAAGALRKESTGWTDQGSGGTSPVLPKMRVSLQRLGELLGGDYDLRMVTFLGDWLGTHTWRINVYKNGSATPVTGFPKTKTSTPTAEDYAWEVPTGNATYCSDVDIEIEETSGGGHETQGFAFEGLVVDYQSRQRTRKLPSGRVVT